MRSKAILAALLFAGGVTAAQADTFTFNFCPGDADCPADLTEASLSFATVDGTADVNDYSVTIRFVGTLTDTYIDAIDFTAGPALAAMPVLTQAPEGTVLGDWTTRFDKISASANNNCSGEIGNHKFVCSKSTTGNGPDMAGINEWIFSVDFAGNGLITPDSPVDLRAYFVDASGAMAGLFSPEGTVATTTTTETPTTTDTPTTTETPTTTGNVPEPAVLSLFGVALAMAGRRLRKTPGRS